MKVLNILRFSTNFSPFFFKVTPPENRLDYCLSPRRLLWSWSRGRRALLQSTPATDVARRHPRHVERDPTGVTPAILSLTAACVTATLRARHPASDCNRSSQFVWQRPTSAAITVSDAPLPHASAALSHLVATHVAFTLSTPLCDPLPLWPMNKNSKHEVLRAPNFAPYFWPIFWDKDTWHSKGTVAVYPVV